MSAISFKPANRPKLLKALLTSGSPLRIGSVGWLLLIFASSAVLLFALLYWLTSGYLLHEVDARLRGELSEFHGITLSVARPAITNLSQREVATSRPYGLFDANDRRLAGNIDRLAPKRAAKPATPFDYTQIVMDRGRRVTAHYRGIVIPLDSGEIIVVGHHIDSILAFDDRLIETLLLGLMLTIVLAVACGKALSVTSNRRIRAINESCLEIMSGRLSSRLPEHGTHHDLDRLAGVVNRMLGEIERLVGEVRNVCAGIAHDLRTPMTQLRATLDRSNRRQQTPDMYREAVDDAIEQCDVVLHRFTALLRIADIDADERRASFSVVQLDAVMLHVVELYEPLAEERAITLRVEADAAVHLLGDVDLIFGAIENLLDNALKFTQKGGKVQIRAGHHSGRATLSIVDNGPGIDVSEREAVLRPFYRSKTNGRALAEPGHGLGLSLVAAIARMHQAQLQIMDCNVGCHITLSFAIA